MRKGILKKAAAAALCAALCFSAYGCGTQADAPSEEENIESSTGQAAEPEEAPVAGGTLRLSMTMAQTFNPLTNCERTVDDILKLIYEPLIAIDESYRPVPSLAESWEFSEDGLSLSITLKGGLYWDNGSPVTADDIVYSLRTIMNSPEDSIYKGCLENVRSYSTVDSQTAVVNFNTAYSGNIYRMTFPLISSAYYSGGLADDTTTAPVGNGAFKFESFKAGDALRLVRSESAANGSPYIERVEAFVVADRATQESMFSRGLTDAIGLTAIGRSGFDVGSAHEINEYPSEYLDYIGFNFSHYILADKNVRKAVAYCLPKDYIMESAYIGRAAATDTLVNPSAWFYNSANVQRYTYNTSHARILLEESGWRDEDEDGMRERDAGYIQYLSLRLLANEENSERSQIARRLADELRSIGFDITLDICSFEEYSQKLAAGDFDIFVGGISFSIVPDLTPLLGSGGSLNFSGYSDSAMDGLLGGARDAANENDVLYAYSELQKYIAEELPYLGIAYRNRAVFTGRRVAGNIGGVENNMFYNVREWFIKEENSQGDE